MIKSNRNTRHIYKTNDSKRQLSLSQQKHRLRKIASKNQPFFIKPPVGEKSYIQEFQKKYVFPQINKLVNQFSVQVMEPISFFNELFNQGKPQMCIEHKNITTLYCKNDSQILCAGCMYQLGTHRSHKVVPLNKAENEMKMNSKQQIKQIEQILIQLKQIQKNCVTAIQKAEIDYPKLMQNLQKYYVQLQQTLNDRRNQQLRLVNQSWNNFRHLQSNLKFQTFKIYQYIQSSIQKIKYHNNEDYVYIKNVSSKIKKTKSLLLNSQYSDDSKYLQKQFLYFQHYKNIFLQSLTLNLFEKKQIQSSGYGKSISKYSKNKSKNKQNKSKSFSNLIQNDHILVSQSISIQDYIDNVVQSKRFLKFPIKQNIKNRHSKQKILLNDQAKITHSEIIEQLRLKSKQMKQKDKIKKTQTSQKTSKSKSPGKKTFRK